MIRNWTILCMLMIGLLLGGTVLRAEAPQTVSPLLPVVQWQGKAVSMEDLKGSVTVFAFFNDDKG